MAKNEKLLKRFYNSLPSKKALLQQGFRFKYDIYVIFVISELFETKSLLREGIYNI